MRRDADLVRQILTAVENLKDGQFVSQNDFPSYDKDLVTYHILLLMGADYLKVISNTAMNGGIYIKVRELTWKGHDYLDSIRS